MIEFALKNFNEKLVASVCLGLDFELKGRSQTYAGPVPNFGQMDRYLRS